MRKPHIKSLQDRLEPLRNAIKTDRSPLSEHLFAKASLGRCIRDSHGGHGLQGCPLDWNAYILKTVLFGKKMIDVDVNVSNGTSPVLPVTKQAADSTS